ncbi:N-acetylglucosamine kinase-like BadF-type ATPase [Arthrobacter sp. CAN_A214]|uniref:N-acetylglucosamine kinase n=1 Tax=Arthrobacter sp. CAN_A214 TaxID=2787720 RepID=UPI0018C9C0EC
MNNSSPSSGPGHIVIGLDIGGSKTRGIRIVNSTVTDDRVAASANIQNVSVHVAASNLAGLLTALGADKAGHIYVGAGGADTDKDQEELRRLIAPYAPDATVTIVHDTRLILAGGGMETGIAVIAGTGSAAWGITADGTEARAGGWGYLLGDEGSGYWLGREAVRHSLRRANLGLPSDGLTTALLARCDLGSPEELIRLFHGDTDRTYWADKAWAVFDCADSGHAASQRLIKQAGEDLAEQTLQVATRLHLPGPVVLGGGLGVNRPTLQEAFTANLALHGITEVSILPREPVFGVLYLIGQATRSVLLK